MTKPFLITLYISLNLTMRLIAQEGNWAMDISSQDNLQEIVNQLTSRQSLLIAYPPILAELKPQIIGRVQVESLEELFTQLFPDQLQIKKIDDTKFLIRDQNLPPNHDQAGRILTGKVVDQYHAVISDIMIYQEGTTGTFSDQKGYYSLEIARDKMQKHVFFQGLGYKLKAIIPDQIVSGSSIPLENDPLQLTTIMVIEQIPVLRTDHKYLSISVRNKTGADQTTSLFFASDVIKKIQMLPGIQADDDLNARIRIRGSEGNESLILLDGIPLYRTDHFYGIFGAVNSNYITDGDLYKNALPIQYGGKTGGMLDLTSNSQIKQFSAVVEVDLLTSSISLFKPLTEKLSWSFAARTSYLQTPDLQYFDRTQPASEPDQSDNRFFSRVQSLSTEPRFNFHDINSKIGFKPSDKFNLDLNLFTSNDQLTNNYDLNYSSQLERISAINTEIYRASENWTNLGASINLFWIINPSWKLHANGYHSSYNHVGSIQSHLSIYTNRKEISTALSNIQEGNTNSTGAHIYLKHSFEGGDLRTGFDFKNNRASYQLTEDDYTLLGGDEKAYEYTFFAENRWKINQLEFTLGSRLTYYSPTRKMYVDPKFQMTYEANPRLLLKTSIHYAHQYLREFNYENRLGQSSNFLLLSNGHEYPVGGSLQFMTGFSFKRTTWNLDVELYHKNLEGVLEYSLQMPGIGPGLGLNRSRSYQIFTGHGKVTGIDILVEKRTRKYAGWFAYTLSKSSRQFERIRFNLPFPAQDDRRHQFKWINQYNIHKFTFSANYIFSSGKPYLALNELPGPRDRSEFAPGIHIRNLPNYERLDVGIDYHFSLLSKKGTLGVSCFNVFDHYNVKYLQYIFSLPVENGPDRKTSTVAGTETSLLGRTPNLRFRLEF